MNGLEKVKFVIDRIQDELYMAKPGMSCMIFIDSFVGKIKPHDLANIITRLEYDKVLRITEPPTSDSDNTYFSIEVLPAFQEYKAEVEHRLGDAGHLENSGFVYTRSTLLLNGKSLLQNHQGGHPDKLFKTLWENKKIIRQGKVIKNGNYKPTKELATIAGYNNDQSTMDRIGFFNQKLATTQQPNSAKIENEKGTGYLLILETDSAVKAINIE